MSNLDLHIVKIVKPENLNFILGQSHFIKTVEDVHEALVSCVSGIKFGFAFCEASGSRLVRLTGTDKRLIDLAKKNAISIGAGHSFIILLGEGYYPINVLKTIQSVSEVVNIFCATANDTEVIIAQTKAGRAILGVVDGGSPNGVETKKEVQKRSNFLREIGYKL